MIFVGFGVFWFGFFNQKTEAEFSFFKGTITEEPEKREKSSHFILSGEEGKLLLVTERYAGYEYGDILEIEGKIVSPEPFDGFDYPGYLAKEGINLTTFYPEIKVVGHSDRYGRRIIDFKEKAGSFLDRSLPQPHSSIAAAMFLGNKRGLSDEWQERLSVAGVRHITAVSGLHVTVVAVIISVIAAGLGINKRKSALIVICAIALFIFMTGMQTSAIRAGIMGGCLIFAGLFGRMNFSLRTAVLAASLMLLLNPLLLKHDIGFQLSFLAVIGIIRFSPPIEKKLIFLPSIARKVTAMSFAAYIFTLPVIIYHFGQVSLVFPVTNLLIVPILHIIMIFGLLFIFLSFISGLVASIVLFPLWFFLTYLIFIVHFFSEIGWSSVTLGSIGPLSMALFYLLIFFVSGRKETNALE